MEWDTGTEEFESVKRKLSDVVDEYFRVCNKENDTQYMPTHYVLMVEGVLIDRPDYSVVFREPSENLSHTKQIGLLRYGLVRLERDVAEDDD